MNGTAIADFQPKLQQVMKTLPLGVFCVILLTQCAPLDHSVKPQPHSGHWVKVSSDPPTFYPSGVSAGCPTDLKSGEWVYTGDTRNTRYFIPFRGCGARRPTLIKEALSARCEQKLNQIKSEDTALRDKNLATAIVFGPLIMSGVTLGAMAGGSIGDGMDIHGFQKDWKESKEPH